MKQKKVLVIGAGVAGLSAGIYARQNGFDAEIVEMHTMPGGLCAAWKRKGYEFDGCIHWLVGTKEGRSFNRIWNELGVLEGKIVHYADSFVRAEGFDGAAAVLWADPDKLERHLLELSPEDAAPVRELARLVRLFKDFDMNLDKPMSMYKLRDIFAMMKSMKPYMKDFNACQKTTVKEFAARFQHPLIRKVLTGLMPEAYSLTALVMSLADYASCNAGFPEGGSLGFARSLEKRFTDLGGVIRYKAKVTTIRVEEGAALGAELEDGTFIAADYTVSAADGRTTLYDFLGGRYLPKKASVLYGDVNRYQTFTSFQVYLGVGCDLSGEPETISLSLEKPVEAAGMNITDLTFHHYCAAAPSFAPEGKSVLMSLVVCPYEFWEKLKNDTAAYTAEKSKLETLVISAAEKRFPYIKGKIEAVDVVTPLTYERYTGVWRGAYMSWLSSPESGRVMLPSSIKGLKNFYMAGIWVMPSGLPAAAITGRWAIQTLCRDGKQQFYSSSIN